MTNWQHIRADLFKLEGFTHFQKIEQNLFIGPEISSMRYQLLKQNNIRQILKLN